VSPDSALSYLKASWSDSDDLFSAATRYVRPGACVWDIGGNVGVFALAAAHRAGSSGRVITVEADPFLASLLQRTALHTRNQDLSVSVLCAAASSASGLARFNVAARGRSSNALEQAGARVTAGGIRYVQVTHRGRTPLVSKFSAAMVDFTSGEDTMPLETIDNQGEFVAKVFGYSDSTTISLVSSYTTPCNITNMEFKGKFKQKYTSLP